MPTCCDTLATIEKICGGTNAAGFAKQIYIACEDEVTAIPAKDNYPTTGAAHTVSTAITLAATKTFKIWNVSDVDQELTTVPDGDPGFQTFITTMKFRIPSVSPLSSHILNGIIGGGFIGIVPDKKGQRLLIGERGNAATLQVEMSLTDKNSYLVTLTWRHSALPLFYTSTITT